jgi:hypothetical protein
MKVGKKKCGLPFFNGDSVIAGGIGLEGFGISVLF